MSHSFLRHVRLCSYQMSFMQALEQMWISLQSELRVVVGALHRSQDLSLYEDMIVLRRACQYVSTALK